VNLFGTLNSTATEVQVARINSPNLNTINLFWPGYVSEALQTGMDPVTLVLCSREPQREKAITSAASFIISSLVHAVWYGQWQDGREDNISSEFYCHEMQDVLLSGS
jgi:hypothetical protein